MAQQPFDKPFDNTWQQNQEDIIMLVNRSQRNYVLDLPAGRYRLDAGRRMRTLRSITKLAQVQELLEQGLLIIEANEAHVSS